MKTRILILFLAIACILSFAACKKDTAASLYTNAMTTMEEANGLEAKVCMKMTMEMAGETQSQDMDMVIKTNGNNMYMTMEDYVITYVDGVLYTDMGEFGKTKETVSLEEFKEQYGSISSTTDFPELTEEALKDVELVEDGDNRSFTVTLDAATMKSYVNELMGDMMGADDSIDLDIKNIVLTPTFDKDDNMTKMIMKMEVSYNMEGLGEMKMSLDMTFEFVNFGTAPTITAPADADSYVTEEE